MKFNATAGATTALWAVTMLRSVQEIRVVEEIRFQCHNASASQAGFCQVSVQDIRHAAALDKDRYGVPLQTHSDHRSKTGASPRDAPSPKQHKQQPAARLQILNTVSLIITREQIREIYRVFLDTRCKTRGSDSSSFLYMS